MTWRRPPSHVAEVLEHAVSAGVNSVRIRVGVSRTTAVAWSAHPSDDGGAGMVTVGTVGGGRWDAVPGSGLSQVTHSKSPTPATRRNILIKVRSASVYVSLLGWCAGIASVSDATPYSDVRARPLSALPAAEAVAVPISTALASAVIRTTYPAAFPPHLLVTEKAITAGLRRGSARSPADPQGSCQRVPSP